MNPAVQQQVIIACRPELVLGAFMNSNHTTQWWMGAQAFFDLDSHAFSWHWRAEDGSFRYMTIGRIASYVSGVYLQLDDIWQYDYMAPVPLGPVSLLLECTPQAGYTLLVVKSTGFDKPGAAYIAYRAAVEEGWRQVLPALKDYLEKLYPAV